MHVELSPNLTTKISIMFSSSLVLFNFSPTMEVIWLQIQSDDVFSLKQVGESSNGKYKFTLILMKPFVGFKNKPWGEEEIFGCWAVNPEIIITHVFWDTAGSEML